MAFIAALRCNRIAAPFVFNQPINAASFTAWVAQPLCPTLGPGDIVVMDSFHKAEMDPVIRGYHHSPHAEKAGQVVRRDGSGPVRGDHREVSQTQSTNRFRSI